MNLTQNEKILNHMKKRSITTWEAIKLYKCTRLARVIGDLKADGKNITKVMEGKGQAQYARYSLVRK